MNGYVLALHSFPTRRSSDLEARGQERVVRAGRAGDGRGAACAGIAEIGGDGGIVLGGAPEGLLGEAVARLRRERARALPELVQDRKSTRLNSSHLVISYAVF